MGIFKGEDLFKEYEKVRPGEIPDFTMRERMAMVVAALWIVLPYFLGIMGGLGILIVILYNLF